MQTSENIGGEEVVRRLRKILRNWRFFAITLRWVHVLLVMIAVGCSLLVASRILSQSETSQGWLAFGAAVAVGLQAALNLGDKANRFRRAWRLLNRSLMLYEAPNNDGIKQLVEDYACAEELIGDVGASGAKASEHAMALGGEDAIPLQDS